MASDGSSIHEPYAALADKLSQGDIVSGVAWGLIENPLVVCRPAQPNEQKGKAQWAHAPLCENPSAFAGSRTEWIHFQAKRDLAIVLWDDCQIDKFENQGRPKDKWFVAVSPVLSMSNLNQSDRGPVFELKKHAFWPLPRNDKFGITQDSYADLRHIVGVRRALLDSSRVTSLSMLGKQALTGHLYKFFTARALPNPGKCKHCGAALTLDDVAPIRPGGA